MSIGSTPIVMGDDRGLIGKVRDLVRNAAIYTGRRWGLLALVAGTSLIIGFGEAGILYIVVKAATSIAAEEHVIDLSIAGLSLKDVTLRAAMFSAGGLLLAVFLLSLVNSAATASMVTRRLNSVRRETYSAYAGARWDLQSSEPEGRLQQFLTAHVNRVGIRALQVSAAISAFVSFLAYLLSAVLVEPIAALAMLAGVFFIGILLVPITRLTRRLSRENAAITTQYSQEVSQAVRMTREIKVFAVTQPVSSIVIGTAEAAERIGYRSRLLARLTPSVYQYSALALVLIGISTLSGGSTGHASQLGAIVVLLVRSLSYGQQFNTALQQMAEAQPFIDAVRELETEYRAHPEEHGEERLNAVAELALADVSYHYGDGVIVLDALSLDLTSGECLGIVGPSGSGKSTLVQILLRLREPTAGRYLVNEVDAGSFDDDSWAANVVLVPQDNALLHGTVAENIRFYRDHLSDDQIRAAARLAHIHEDIEDFPEGYDSVIGPGARDLSGGQRQRIGLARALAGEPTLLILDEPTSALDMRSEELIQQTLRELRGRVTLVIVAHRVPTLAICDRILVLDRGKRVAIGPHHELERTDPFYREAVRLSQVTAT
jgi:ATP-binding cassette subfamily B protein